MTPSSSVLFRRDFHRSIGIFCGGLAAWRLGISPFKACGQSQVETIPVGILHSLSGSMGTSGRTLVDAFLMAMDAVNARGNVLGHPLHPFIEDGESRPEIFAKKSQDLIQRQHVKTIFGYWASASRKAVLPIVEAERSLLWHPD